MTPPGPCESNHRYVRDFYNRKGLISNRGERKQAFFVLQTYYRELANAIE